MRVQLGDHWRTSVLALAAAIGATKGVKTCDFGVTELRLENEKITPKECVVLAGLLRISAVLKVLWLRGNNIGDAGAAALGGALEDNAALTTLDLRVNQIGPTGVEALAGALRVNAVLTTLYLGDNNIGDAGASALASALSINAVLTGGKPCTVYGVRGIPMSLLHHTTSGHGSDGRQAA